MTSQDRYLGTAGGIPNASGLVVGGGGNAVAGSIEGGICHRGFMFEDSHLMMRQQGLVEQAVWKLEGLRFDRGLFGFQAIAALMLMARSML